MHIHGILQSLRQNAGENPMATALDSVGFVATNIHHGARARTGAEKPFALLNGGEIDREENTSGVSLVTYQVTLQIVGDELVGGSGGVGTIMEMFHRYWDRIIDLDALDSNARFVDIHPVPDSEIGEADAEELGRDLILGTTAWTIQLSEHKPDL